MKRLLLTICILLCTAATMAAQTESAAAPADSTQKKMAGVIRMTIPPKLNIKDNIYIQNKSPYLILQMVLALDTGDGSYSTIGRASYVPSNGREKIASFDDNKLKKLRGLPVVLKVKGAKINPRTEGANVDVYIPFGSVNVHNKKPNPEDIKDIDESKITYDFRAFMFESDHDLYIQIEAQDALDF